MPFWHVLGQLLTNQHSHNSNNCNAVLKSSRLQRLASKKPFASDQGHCPSMFWSSKIVQICTCFLGASTPLCTVQHHAFNRLQSTEPPPSPHNLADPSPLAALDAYQHQCSIHWQNFLAHTNRARQKHVSGSHAGPLPCSPRRYWAQPKPDLQELATKQKQECTQ